LVCAVSQQSPERAVRAFFKAFVLRHWFLPSIYLFFLGEIFVKENGVQIL
jgi:hypothetical protein